MKNTAGKFPLDMHAGWRGSPRDLLCSDSNERPVGGSVAKPTPDYTTLQVPWSWLARHAGRKHPRWTGGAVLLCAAVVLLLCAGLLLWLGSIATCSCAAVLNLTKQKGRFGWRLLFLHSQS